MENLPSLEELPSWNALVISENAALGQLTCYGALHAMIGAADSANCDGDGCSVVEHLRGLDGVETAAMADQPLLGSVGWNNFVSVDGAPPNEVLVSMLSVSPGWVEAMKIPLFEGREFDQRDRYPGAAIVSQSFARTFLHGRNPVGTKFEIVFSGGARRGFRAVGLVGDTHYRTLREPIQPQVYVPFHRVDANGAPGMRGRGSLLVRVAGPNPLAPAELLRREIPRARPEFRVSRIRTQMEINQSHTVRERLLAALGLFFAAVALLLAGVGFYGVLHYTVLQRRREIGIPIAIGAQPGDIAWRVTADAFLMVLVGAFAGLAAGMALAQYFETLFYEVKPTDLTMLALPSLAVFATSLLAALSPVIRAARIDPVMMLHSE